LVFKGKPMKCPCGSRAAKYKGCSVAIHWEAENWTLVYPGADYGFVKGGKA